MAAIPAVVIGVILPHQQRVTCAKGLAVCIVRQAHCPHGAFLLCAETTARKAEWPGPLPCCHVRLALMRMLPRPRADGFERIGKIAPARDAVHARIGPEGARLTFPTVQWRLRAKNFLRLHSFEIVVSGVELAHMVQTEPAVFARAVETGWSPAWSAEFSCVLTSGPLAYVLGRIVPSMKSIVSHRL